MTHVDDIVHWIASGAPRWGMFHRGGVRYVEPRRDAVAHMRVLCIDGTAFDLAITQVANFGDSTGYDLTDFPMQFWGNAEGGTTFEATPLEMAP